MMMAKNTTPDGPSLSDESIAILRSALTEFLADSTRPSRLQPALRRIAIEARENRMHAEQLLLVLKDVWYSLPQVAGNLATPEQNHLLQRVVTLCIREYYSG